MRNAAEIYVMELEPLELHLQHFFQDYRQATLNEITRRLTVFGPSRATLKVTVRFSKPNTLTNEPDFDEPAFSSGRKDIPTLQAVPEVFAQMVQKISQSFETYEGRGSGWTAGYVLEAFLTFTSYQPLTGGRITQELPSWVTGKQCVLTIKTENNDCFRWAVLASLLNVTNHAERISNYTPFANALAWPTDEEIPVSLDDIDRFEELNNGISVNVYDVAEDPNEEHPVRPLRLTKISVEQHVNLLLHAGHYYPIRRMSALVSGGDNKRIHPCRFCNYKFQSVQQLDQHETRRGCLTGDVSSVKMPEEGKTIKFKSYQKGLMAPFVIFADFEALLPKDARGWQTHKACGFCVYLSCVDPKKNRIFTYRGTSEEDTLEQFIKCMVKFRDYILQNINTPIQMTPEDNVNFGQARTCYLCGGSFSLGNQKVRDHCHVTGKYRGAACNQCNLQLRISRTTPVFFHNLSRYDSHMIVRAMANNSGLGLPDVLPRTKEEFITLGVNLWGKMNGGNFRIHRFSFQDSFRLLPEALAKLSGNLSLDQLHHTRLHYGQETLGMLDRKGVYPYSAMVSFDQFDEPTDWKREDFRNDLTGDEISEEDFNRYLKARDAFGLDTKGKYHDFYCKLDVLLLADVVDNFRFTGMRIYGVDPAHYVSLPSFSWDSMLRFTGVDLGLIYDLEQHEFIEKAKRGGLCQVSKRYAVANNKDMKDFDPGQTSSYLIDQDLNNLYGWAMMQSLPIGNYQWVDPELFTVPMIMARQNSEPYGYFLEVDLDYPEELHDLHSDLPLLPEKMIVPDELQSSFGLALPGQKRISEKLVTTLLNKRNYVLHVEALKQVLAHGLILKKVHRVLGFSQSPWLKPFIELNSRLRREAKNPFEKDLFKLINNSIFGKTIENVRDRINFRLISDRKTTIKLASRPEFQDITIYGENLVGIMSKKAVTELDRPIAVGVAVLDLAKVLLYSDWYRLKCHYRNRISLLKTDTDSLMFEVLTNDWYHDMKTYFSDRYDTSNFPVDHPLFSRDREKIPGYQKDESGGLIIRKFAGLKQKYYSQEMDLDQSKKVVCAGISRGISKKIPFDHFEKAIFEQTQYVIQTKTFMSVNHQIFTVPRAIVALSAHDDKRFILEDGITTRALGHYRNNR